VIPVAGMLICCFLMYTLGAHVFRQLWLYFLVGIVVYFVYGQFHSKLAKEGVETTIMT
jgi:APA family basic amino acid/polyamine antiporter